MLIRELHDVTGDPSTACYVSGIRYSDRGGSETDEREGWVLRVVDESLVPVLRTAGVTSVLRTSAGLVMAGDRGVYREGAGVHVARVDPSGEGAFELVPTNFEVSRLAELADGSVFAWGFEKVVLWDGERFRDFPNPRLSQKDHAECALTGRGLRDLWALVGGQNGGTVLRRYEGETWRTVDDIELPGNSTLSGADGALYFGSPRAISRWSGRKGDAVETLFALPEGMHGMVWWEGAVWVAAPDGIFRIEGSTGAKVFDVGSARLHAGRELLALDYATDTVFRLRPGAHELETLVPEEAFKDALRGVTPLWKS